MKQLQTQLQVLSSSDPCGSIILLIQSRKNVTFVYTSGCPKEQPEAAPKETVPTRTLRPDSITAVAGPPESPLHDEPAPPLVSKQRLLSKMYGPNVRAQFSFDVIGAVVFIKIFDGNPPSVVPWEKKLF